MILLFKAGLSKEQPVSNWPAEIDIVQFKF